MYMMEVLQGFPSQNKTLFISISIVDPLDAHMLSFILDLAKPHLCHQIAFPIQVSCRGTNILWCVIDKGDLAYVI